MKNLAIARRYAKALLMIGKEDGQTETYKEELSLASFQSLSISDITPDVIRGFKAYRRWLRDMKKQHFLEDLFLKLYYTIHVQMNIYLLKNRRQYCVFVGSKPE